MEKFKSFLTENVHSFMRTYKRNEAQNRHTQNVVHLATHYGTEADQAEAHKYLQALKKHGHQPYHAEASVLHHKLWNKAVADYKQRSGTHPLHEEAALAALSENGPKEYKVGDIVHPKIGPHKGHPHEVIHVLADKSVNIKPVGLKGKQIRYHLGAAHAKPEHLNEVETHLTKKPTPFNKFTKNYKHPVGTIKPMKHELVYHYMEKEKEKQHKNHVQVPVKQLKQQIYEETIIGLMKKIKKHPSFAGKHTEPGVIRNVKRSEIKKHLGVDLHTLWKSRGGGSEHSWIDKSVGSHTYTLGHNYHGSRNVHEEYDYPDPSRQSLTPGHIMRFGDRTQHAYHGFKDAKKSRDEYAKHLKSQGHKIRTHSLKNQLLHGSYGNVYYIDVHHPLKEEVHVDMEKREKIVHGMKKKIAGFRERYGKRAKEVMYRTANKMSHLEEARSKVAGVTDPNKIKKVLAARIKAREFRAQQKAVNLDAAERERKAKAMRSASWNRDSGRQIQS